MFRSFKSKLPFHLYSYWNVRDFWINYYQPRSSPLALFPRLLPQPLSFAVNNAVRRSREIQPNLFVFCSGPGPPSRVRFSNVGSVSVTIAWDPPVYPRGVITRYRVEYRFNSTSSGFIRQSILGPNVRKRTAGPLSPQSFYRFFVWAGTNTSWSDPPAEAVVYTGGSTGK